VATVHFPSGWKEHTGGVDELVVDAPRVDQLILALAARFPALTEQLEEVAVAIDGQIYHHARYEALSSRSEVHFLPPVAGG
jgi:molybdopterin converting factor small subunit